tara:strand:+ start:193 stop:1152 length:960 start_codon:yes stop_codon:yes gene_type:complete
MNDTDLVQKLHIKKEVLFNEIAKVIIGQREIIDNIFIALLCRGHILLEGVPGLGKTLLIKTLADVMDLSFNRIQFTPDLMPSDITGTELINQNRETGDREFKFFKGPIFSNIVLADEINRTPPKTQSALLEAMQEQNVTYGGKTYKLDAPFFVLATQNPIEQEGTYPLPEAQLDRFMFNLLIKYPTHDEEIQIVDSTTKINEITINRIITNKEIQEFQNLVLSVPIAKNLVDYAVKIVESTRIKNDLLDWGAGPRASYFLILAAKARAVTNGKPTPDIDDIKNMILPVLRHRIIPSFNAEADGISRDDIISSLIKSNEK